MTESNSPLSRRPVRLDGLAVKVATAGGVGAVLLTAIIFGQEIGLGIVMGIIAIAAVSELYVFTRREQRLPMEFVGVFAAGSMPVAAALGGRNGLLTALTIFVIVALVLHLIRRQSRTSDTAVVLFGAIYVGFLLAHFVLIRHFETGMLFALVTILSVWANDVFAYLVGSAMGRHKLAPRISPNKSWEGFIAGTVFTLCVWAAIALLPQTTLSIPALLSLGLAVSVAAVIGDLFESRLKREAGVKDSGSILPGHGGILDRFDSLIVASVPVYYLLVWLGIG